MSSQKRSSRLCLIAAERDSLKELQLSKGKRSSKMAQSRRKQQSSLGTEMLDIEEEEDQGNPLMLKPLFPLPTNPMKRGGPFQAAKEGENLIKQDLLNSKTRRSKGFINGLPKLPKSSHQIEISGEKEKTWESIKNSMSKSSYWAEEPHQAPSEVEIEIFNSEMDESRVIEVSELPLDEEIPHSDFEESEILSPMTRQNQMFGVKKDSDFLNDRSQRAVNKNYRLKNFGPNPRGDERINQYKIRDFGENLPASPYTGRKASENETIKVTGLRDFGRKKRNIKETDVLNLYNKTIDFNNLPKTDQRSSNSRDRTKSAKKRTTPILTEQLITPKKKKKTKNKNKYENQPSIEEKISLNFSAKRNDRVREFKFNLFDAEHQGIVQSEIFDLAPMKLANQEISEVVKSMSKIKIPMFMTSEAKIYNESSKKESNESSKNKKKEKSSDFKNIYKMKSKTDSRTYQIARDHPALTNRKGKQNKKSKKEQAAHSIGPEQTLTDQKKSVNILRQSHHLVLGVRGKKSKKQFKGKGVGKKSKRLLDKKREFKPRGKKKNLSSKKLIKKTKFQNLTPKPKKSSRKLITRHSTRLQNDYLTRKNRKNRKSIRTLDPEIRAKIKENLTSTVDRNKRKKNHNQSKLSVNITAPKSKSKRSVNLKPKQSKRSVNPSEKLRKDSQNLQLKVDNEEISNQKNENLIVNRRVTAYSKSKQKTSVSSRASSQYIEHNEKKKRKSVISQNLEKKSTNSKFRTSKIKNKTLKSKRNLKNDRKKPKNHPKINIINTPLQNIARINNKQKNSKTRANGKEVKSKKLWKEKKRVKKSAKKPPRSSKASRRNVKKRVKRHKRTLTNLQALEAHYQTFEKEFSKTHLSNMLEKQYHTNTITKTHDFTDSNGYDTEKIQNSLEKQNIQNDILQRKLATRIDNAKKQKGKVKEISMLKWQAILAQKQADREFDIESQKNQKNNFKIERSEVRRQNRNTQKHKFTKHPNEFSKTSTEIFEYKKKLKKLGFEKNLGEMDLRRERGVAGSLSVEKRRESKGVFSKRETPCARRRKTIQFE